MKKKTIASDLLYGYIQVKLENPNPESVLNRCVKFGITMREVQRLSFTTILFKMKRTQYLKLKNAIRGTGTRTRIVKKRGICFTLGRVGRRKFFIAGSAVFIAVLLTLSSFIWSIEITGNKSISAKSLLLELDECGFKSGSLKYILDLRSIEESMLKRNERISVIKIDMNGTKAIVDVVERAMPSEIIDESLPVDIIAAKDGVIMKVLTYRGKEAVQSGDVVKPGQLLISGTVVDLENQEVAKVHAKGVVIAKTWQEFISEVNLNYITAVRTGRFKTIQFISVAGKSLKVKNSNINFKKYDKIRNVEQISLFQFKLPVQRITETYYENIDVKRRLSQKDALSIAIRLADTNVKDRLDLVPEGRITDRKINQTIDHDKLKIKVLYTVEENIGKETVIK